LMWLCFRERTAPSSLHHGLRRQTCNRTLSNWQLSSHTGTCIHGCERNRTRLGENDLDDIYLPSGCRSTISDVYFAINQGSRDGTLQHAKQYQIPLELPCRSTVPLGLLLDLQCFMQSCRAAEVDCRGCKETSRLSMLPLEPCNHKLEAWFLKVEPTQLDPHILPSLYEEPSSNSHT